MSNTGFLFPGQGAQTVGMGREIAESVPACMALFDQANEVLGYDLKQICLDGPVETLNLTEHSQPALFVTSMIALEQVRQSNDAAVQGCSVAAGLSLGEYSALCFAGVMSFEDALRVVRKRGVAMQKAADAQSSGMLAVLGLEPAQVEDLVNQARGDGVLETANYLCPGNIVCSGDDAACDRLKPLAEAAGAMKVIPLPVAGAFHTSLMDSAVSELAAALAEIEMHDPRIPVVSNVDAKPHSDAEEIRSLLTQQVVSPVRWSDSIQTMLESGRRGIL